MSLKEVFTVGDVEYAVVRPTQAGLTEGQRVYNKAFREAAVEGEAILREALDEVMRKQGLWDDKKESEYKALTKAINVAEAKLTAGNIKKSEATGIAFTLRKQRNELRKLVASRTSLDSLTAQGQADNARFNTLVALCTVYNKDGKLVYKDVADYTSRSGDEVAVKAATKLASMMYGLDSNYEANLPENKALLKLKVINSNLQLINAEGKAVDEEGRLIDSENRFINADGKYVDIDGNLVDEAGNLISEEKPFLDDETGEPLS
jgi:hypothetical protein